MSFNFGGLARDKRDESLAALQGNSTERASSTETPTDGTGTTEATETVTPIAGASTDAGDGAPQEATPEATEGTAGTQQAGEEGESDPDASIPFNKHPRFQQLLKEAAEAKALKVRIAELEATTTAKTDPQSSAATTETASVTLPTVDPASIVTSDQVTAAEAAFEQLKQGILNGRTQYEAAQKERVRTGEIPFEEMEADIAQKDAVAEQRLQREAAAIENLRLKRDLSDRLISERATAAKSAFTPELSEKYPYAKPEEVSQWVAAGYGVEESAKFVHDRYAPVVSAAAEKAKAEGKAEAEATAAEALKKAEAEITRLKKLNDNLAAAPDALRSGRGTAAPSGVDQPAATGSFNMGQKIRAMRKQGYVGRSPH